MAAITEAVATGELSLGEAETASALVERFTRSLEAGEFEKRLRALEEENRRLKEMVADLSLDKEALKTVIRKNGWSL